MPRRLNDLSIFLENDILSDPPMLAPIGHELPPLEIVVVNARTGSRYGHNDFVSAGCGMGHTATMYLLERGASAGWTRCAASRTASRASRATSRFRSSRRMSGSVLGSGYHVP